MLILDRGLGLAKLSYGGEGVGSCLNKLSRKVEQRDLPGVWRNFQAQTHIHTYKHSSKSRSLCKAKTLGDPARFRRGCNCYIVYGNGVDFEYSILEISPFWYPRPYFERDMQKRRNSGVAARTLYRPCSLGFGERHRLLQTLLIQYALGNEIGALNSGENFDHPINR